MTFLPSMPGTSGRVGNAADGQDHHVGLVFGEGGGIELLVELDVDAELLDLRPIEAQEVAQVLYLEPLDHACQSHGPAEIAAFLVEGDVMASRGCDAGGLHARRPGSDHDHLLLLARGAMSYDRCRSRR